MAQPVEEIRFRLFIPAAEFLRYYAGDARDVVVKAEDGRVLRFPAKLLQRFVTRDGISGRFLLRYDADGRFQSIERLPG